MTLKELRQYRSLCSEIIELRATLKEHKVHETVRGSDSAFPYLTHSMSVTGVPEATSNIELLEEVRKLEKQKGEIEGFIDSIEDSLTRRIFKMRFIRGWSWVKVAIKTGNNTSSSVKMICYRYMKNEKK